MGKLTTFKCGDTVDVNLYSEIIILDENRGLGTQSIADRINSLSANINVQAPQSSEQLQESSTTIINNVTIYVNNEIEALATDVPTSTIPTFPPTSTFTPIVDITNPPPPTITPQHPTPIIPTTIAPPLANTPTLLPTLTPTLPAFVWIPLPTQTEVFSTNCPLINHARVFAQFYQGQARIFTVLGNGKTNQGLRLDFSNASYQGANYAGWEVWLGADDYSGIDLTSYNSLVFYIRGQSGGEEPNVYLMMPVLSDYWRFWRDIELVTPVTTSWRRVEIPLSYFASSQEPNQQVDLTNIQRIQILFEWYAQPTSGRIFIDDLCVQ